MGTTTTEICEVGRNVTSGQGNVSDVPKVDGNQPRGRKRREVSDKIACPSCGVSRTKVLPKRIYAPQNIETYYRWRRCTGCHVEFVTEERVAFGFIGHQF